jgi:hypothetical protein
MRGRTARMAEHLQSFSHSLMDLEVSASLTLYKPSFSSRIGVTMKKRMRMILDVI